MTNQQKQCLLAYLGFYRGTIQGNWNEETVASVLKFQKAVGIEADETCGSPTQQALLYAVTYGLGPVPV